ncbi:CubicO group peptidase (beta-lactamase class C family) [Sphingomonas naasensis]|uniref:Class A beta-lactamase-related serine hydrolase n=1 Tax=Sphingomonas naasensis TaxID=1344951 RepID=A0A4S1WJG6_9SPHN|nr:serine hydrolase domain-containing protein [Sphingomonas naasensis]NIJ20952.1 CubicO group peptidase (beta-lactamase class C family) [Sphingomonas naasensis]TGX43338.1 class A beta-lactamase-related serine hydrolase [Sphingomonas naasensis]
MSKAHPRRRALLGGLAAAAALLAGGAAAQPAGQRCATPPAAAGGPSNAHTRLVETQLRPPVIQHGGRPYTLAERMRSYDVPGVGVAVIHRGKLDWARGWGLRDAATCAPVTPDTAFQAASISKVATAMVALRLVEQGKLALDRDINAFLRSWQLPRDAKLAPDGVTLRQLLSHTAGLGVHGFAGYRPDAPLPTPAQILDGTPPANSAAVRSTGAAGAQWVYSGGGYVLVQLALSDVSGLPFAALAERELLRPLGMTRSGYAQPPSPALGADIAFAHAQGAPIPGNYHVYPELGPAGLWTSAADLARLLIDVQGAVAGRPGHRLSPAMARAMLAPVKGNWGLGPAVYPDGARRFGHDGLNEGFQSYMMAYADRGEGIVVLVNGGQGRRLIDEIVRAVATDYGWTDIAAPAVEEQLLSPAQRARAAGAFEADGLAVTLEARPDGLFAETGDPRPERLLALSATRFASEARGIVVQFAPDFASFDIVEGGPPLHFVRAKPPGPARP